MLFRYDINITLSWRQSVRPLQTFHLSKVPRNAAVVTVQGTCHVGGEKKAEGPPKWILAHVFFIEITSKISANADANQAESLDRNCSSLSSFSQQP